jgi:hypothetical protein
MLAGIHRKRRKESGGRGRVSASGTGAGDLLVSDAVRGGSLVGRPITLMGLEPAVVSGRPATHPVELRARIGSCRFAPRRSGIATVAETTIQFRNPAPHLSRRLPGKEVYRDATLRRL